ncbi:MAG: DUF45 domain-containing protein [Alteromonadaceae bacterium]|nr:DUF45 domain-containing protein [Alteromonadaceae bacterium]
MLSTLFNFSRNKDNQAPYDIDFMGMAVRVTPKKVKNLRLKVDLTNKDISVSVPFYLSQQDVINFLHSKQTWLLRQLQKSSPVTESLEYNEGERLPLWGEMLIIRHELAAKKKVYRDDSQFFFCSPSPLDVKTKQKLLTDFYRREMLIEANQLLATWQPRIGKHVNFLGIKNMKTKWGSCNITKARVWLSLYLAQYPKTCIEMVLVHELVHLLEASHNKKFYALMSEFLPSWEQSDAILKTQPMLKM